MWVSNLTFAALVTLQVLGGTQPNKRYVIDDCKPNDERNTGEEMSYAVTFARAGDFQKIVTWLDGPQTAKSPDSVTVRDGDRRTYTVKLTVPSDHQPGMAKLMTKIDGVEARKCDVKVMRRSDPATPPNPFASVALAGTINDPSGAALPGITVTARDRLTGQTFSSVTDASGQYRLHLQPGQYELTAEMAGFSIQTREVTIKSGPEVTVNVTIKQ